MITVSDFGMLDVSNAIINSEDPNIYDESGQHVLAYLLENFSDPLDNTLFQKIIKNPQLDISDIATQHSMMSVWSSKIIKYLMARESIIEEILPHINWNILIPINFNNNPIQFQNNRSYTKVYAKEKISWIQFAILENWTLLREGMNFCENKVGSINLNNSLDENIFHLIARSYVKTPRPPEYFTSLLEVILPHFNQLINIKNKENKTPIDIMENSMYYKGEYKGYFSVIIEFIKTWDLKYNLENNLTISNEKKTKIKI